MPNGEGDVREIWQAIRKIEVQIAALASTVAEQDKRWSALGQRQSQIPTWIWLAVTVALTSGLWLADRVFEHVP